MNNSALFDYTALAEASYADFASFNNYSDEDIRGLLKNPTAGGKGWGSFGANLPPN